MSTKIKQSVASALFIGTAALQVAHGQPTELFISEYVEGSSHNKAVEIFNGTGASVDLSSYKLQYYFNGSSSAGRTIALTGIVADGDTFVVAHSSADPQLINNADMTSGGSWYNGNDAVALLNGGVDIDVIGQIGYDPGTRWGSGSTSTQNNTLRRQASVCVGDGDGYNTFDPNIEWDGYAQDTFDGVGAHSASCSDSGGDGSSFSYIHEIQGSGASSPMENQSVTVQAIVVGDFQDSDELSGFFLQEEDVDADTDSLTSEGIFVNTGNGGTDVNVGDLVEVTGQVKEYYELTELTNVSVTVLSSGNILPTAASVSLPFATSDELERYEGMLVTLDQTLTVTENYNLSRYGEIWLSSGGRLMAPTNVALPGTDANNVQAQNDLNRILLDDGSTLQNPDPIIYPDPELTAFNTVRSGDTVANLTGVLNYAYSEYRLQATQTPNFVQENLRTAAPANVGGTLKVASFNVLNYFNGNGQGGGFPTTRGADTEEEFIRQRDKIIAAISAMEADIIGLMEIENDGYDSLSAIQDLVNGLNAAAPSDTSYAFVDPGVSAIGTDEIAVGFIYREETVTPVGNAAILDSSVDSRFNDNKNRPTLAQTFSEIASGGTMTIAVNHLKSKGSSCDDMNDPDTGDGQGNCNLTRTRATEAMVEWLAGDPTNSGDEDFMIIGDLNAYAKEDPITALKNGGYIELLDTHIGAANTYSYIFKGQSGYLDHALASAKLADQVSGITIWHSNSDEPRVLDYNTEYKSAYQISSLYYTDPYRSSDHDAVVIGLNLDDGSTDNPPSANINSYVSDLDGNTINQGRKWTAVVTVEVRDNLGQPVSGATVSGNWNGRNVSNSASCTTASNGRCTVAITVAKRRATVAYNVTNVQHSSLSYDENANFDLDGDSNGTSISLSKQNQPHWLEWLRQLIRSLF